MKILLISTVLIFALFACKTKKGTAQTKKLENSAWQVILLGIETPKSIQTIIIKDQSVKGKAACNGFSGSIEIGDSDSVTFSNIISTKMGCDQLPEENLFFQKLKKTTNYTLKKEELSFYNFDNKLLVKLKKIQL